MKRIAVVTGMLLCFLLLPLIFVATLLSISADQPSPSDRALEEIPPRLIAIYEEAADTCEGLEWTVLAAIHKVETGFETGSATSGKGAQGPMQFMPATFAAYGVDGDAD